MAHGLTDFDNVNYDQTVRLMLANKPAWHGLGTVLDHAPDSHTAITVAGMDRHVSMVPLQTNAGHEVPGVFGTVYDDRPHDVLGVVSDRYRVIQNIDGFKLLDSLVANGDMAYESCGSLDGGRRTWILGRFPTVDEIAEGDSSLRYVLFYNSHDGKSSFGAIPTATRVVCANTLAMALGKLKGMSHKGNMAGKMGFARNYLAQFDETFIGYRDNARLLATRMVSPTDAIEYIAKLFPIPEEIKGTKGEARQQNNIIQVRNSFREPSNQLASIRGTWWQLLNSVTHFVDHDPRKDESTLSKKEKRFASLIDGTGSELKTKALNLAMEMSA